MEPNPSVTARLQRSLHGSAGEGLARGTTGLEETWGGGRHREKHLGHGGDRLRLDMD